MSICIRYTRNEDRAKEVLNMGFHRILQQLDKYREKEVPFKSWIRAVMINTLINEYHKERKHATRINYVEHYIEESDHSVINEAVRQLNIKEIYKLIASLPEMQQQVFNLYFIDGYKHREIAELLKINENTSKWYLTTAKDKLKEMIIAMEIIAKR